MGRYFPSQPPADTIFHQGSAGIEVFSSIGFQWLNFFQQVETTLFSASDLSKTVWWLIVECTCAVASESRAQTRICFDDNFAC